MKMVPYEIDTALRRVGCPTLEVYLASDGWKERCGQFDQSFYGQRNKCYACQNAGSKWQHTNLESLGREVVQSDVVRVCEGCSAPSQTINTRAVTRVEKKRPPAKRAKLPPKLEKWVKKKIKQNRLSPAEGNKFWRRAAKRLAKQRGYS